MGSGPGLVTGGPPVKLSEESHTSSNTTSEVSETRRTERIDNYSWTNDGMAKVKLYVEVPPHVLKAKDQVVCDFSNRSFKLDVTSDENVVYRCSVSQLHAEIVPEECSFRASVEKGRVTITLKKDREVTWDAVVGR